MLCQACFYLYPSSHPHQISLCQSILSYPLQCSKCLFLLLLLLVVVGLASWLSAIVTYTHTNESPGVAVKRISADAIEQKRKTIFFCFLQQLLFSLCVVVVATISSLSFLEHKKFSEFLLHLQRYCCRQTPTDFRSGAAQHSSAIIFYDCWLAYT